MNRKEKARLNLFLRYLLLIGLGIVMIYPLCWMIGASFKTNSEDVYKRQVHSAYNRAKRNEKGTYLNKLLGQETGAVVQGLVRGTHRGVEENNNAVVPPQHIGLRCV